jgi:hypothetical protein
MIFKNALPPSSPKSSGGQHASSAAGTWRLTPTSRMIDRKAPGTRIDASHASPMPRCAKGSIGHGR